MFDLLLHKHKSHNARLVYLTVISSEDSVENDFSSHFLGLTISVVYFVVVVFVVVLFCFFLLLFFYFLVAQPEVYKS